MKHNQWRKINNDDAVPSSSHWSGDWERRNDREEMTSNEGSNNSNPHPLDYSKEGRGISRYSSKGNLRISEGIKTPPNKHNDKIYPNNQWAFSGMHQYNMFPNSNRNPHNMAYNQNPWRTMNQGYLFENQYQPHSRSFENNKWWEDSYDCMNSQFRNPSHAEHIQSFEPFRMQWSNHSKYHRSDNYNDFGNRYSKYNSFDRYKSGRDSSQYLSSQNYKYRTSYNCRPSSSREHQSRPSSAARKSHLNLGNASRISRSTDSFRTDRNIFSTSFATEKKKSDLITKKRNNIAEVNRRKALSAAASKLKQTFLAGKKGKAKGKSISKENNSSFKISEKKSIGKTKRKMLKIPKSIPTEGTSLEHDIDIKFSSSEWETVGRGEGASRDVVHKDSLTAENSDSESVQIIEDSTEEISDNESICSTSQVDIGEDRYQTRKRRASESCVGEIRNEENVKIPRLRSLSESQLEENIAINVNPAGDSNLAFRLKSILMNELMQLDKKSLKQLVDDPKSHKSQVMMNLLMDLHRNFLSQKLNQLHFKSLSLSFPGKDSEAYSSNSNQVGEIPSDIMEQINQILRFEASGEAQLLWEEVTMSLSDLLNLSERDSDSHKMHQEAQNEHMFSNSLQSACNTLEEQDVLVVTPPPKRPTTTITLPDSDGELISDSFLFNANSHLISPGSSIDSACQIRKDLPARSSPVERSSNNDQFLKPYDLTRNQMTVPPHDLIRPQIEIEPHDLTRSSPNLDHSQSSSDQEHHSQSEGQPGDLTQLHCPPNQSPSHESLAGGSLNAVSHLTMPDLLSSSSSRSPPSLSSVPRPVAPIPPFPESQSPSPALSNNSTTDQKVDGKFKEDDGLRSTEAPNSSDINLAPPVNVRVKQERPSPMMECGICMHRSRSPHTPHCGYSFGIHPPPVALMPGSPKPLGVVPPQRPLPHLASSALASSALASSALASSFKQERVGGSFINLEHVNRPSSEERPKNPAPPDNASSEPPSPLPIPPPQANLHSQPPPQPLLFSSDDQFIEPPRPPSPPPLQHSPRIKIERQTPQYFCCCMRNECERSSSSRQSAEMSKRSPQGQLSESAVLRPTPHSLYKVDPSFIPSLRPRTPHNGVVGLFPSISPTARFMHSSSSHAVLPHLLSNHVISSLDVSAANKTDIGIQTDFLLQSSLSRANDYAQNELPPPVKIDQATSTIDIPETFPVSDLNESCNFESAECSSGNISPCIVSTSSMSDDRLASVYNRVKNVSPTGSQNEQLSQIIVQQKEVLKCLDIIERRERTLAKDRKKMRELLNRLSQLSADILQKQDSNTENRMDDRSSNLPRPDSSAICTNLEGSESERIAKNGSQVSSSQEETNICSNPGQICTLLDMHERVRCSSTSLKDPEDVAYKREPCSQLPVAHESASASSVFKYIQHEEHWLHNDNFCYEEKELVSVRAVKSKHDENDAENCCFKPTNDEFSERSGDAVENPQVVLKYETVKKEVEESTVFENREKVCHTSDIFCNSDNALISLRKHSLLGSPPSPKLRTSGCEHGYSLRSRGPPNDLYEINTDGHYSKDVFVPVDSDDHVELPYCKLTAEKIEISKPVDSDYAEEEENGTACKECDHQKSFHELRKPRRKRKLKYTSTKSKKRKESEYKSPPPSCSKSLCPSVVELSAVLNKEKMKVPPAHLDAVLDIKVIGNLIFTSSMDGLARLFDSSSGVVLSTYENHTDSVTCIEVLGKPQFSARSPDFQVATGSEDCCIRIYDGKTGLLTLKKNCGEPVRCMSFRWDYLFWGTDGGSGFKWNLKDKKLNGIRFSGKGITHLMTHVEGGRKVLLASAKTTPIMIRDAMSGLFLRTLEYAQLTVYSAVFDGSLLYTGGADKNIHVYDYCVGTVKEHVAMEASVSSLMVHKGCLIAVCYDGSVRIYKLPKIELIHVLPVHSSHKMYICSAIFKNKILLGNKKGEIVACDLPESLK